MAKYRLENTGNIKNVYEKNSPVFNTKTELLQWAIKHKKYWREFDEYGNGAPIQIFKQLEEFRGNYKNPKKSKLGDWFKSGSFIVTTKNGSLKISKHELD